MLTGGVENRSQIMYYLLSTCTQAAGLEQPAGSMLALPLLDFPNGQYILSSNWRLPNGRDGNQHHLFPVEVPSDPMARQGPMLPADHFTSSGLDVQLQVVVGKLLLLLLLPSKEEEQDTAVWRGCT